MALIIGLYIIEGLLCYAFGMPNASNDVCEIVSVILLAGNSIALSMYVMKRYSNYSKQLSTIFCISVFIKMFLIIWDYYGTSIFILPNSHSDSESYHWSAVRIAHHLSGKIENYGIIIGYIYKLFGIQRITAQFSNTILSFIGISALEKIMHNLKISKSSREKTLFFSALLPNYLIISSILIRECLISIILCFALYFFIKWWKTNNYVVFLEAILISFLACYYHSGAIAVTIGFSITLVLTKWQNNERVVNVSFKSLILAVILGIVFMYLFNVLSESILWRFHGLGMDSLNTYIDEHHLYEEHSEGTSSYSAGFSGISGIPGLIINTPIRTIYFLWVPMPWSIRGIGDIIAFFGSSLFYGGTIFYTISKLYKHQCSNSTKSILIAIFCVALSSAVVFAWGVESAGTALRHREKFYFIYLLLFALLQENNLIMRNVEINGQQK